MKSVVFEFLIWKPPIVAKIYFSSHSHYFLLLITQCGFLICSLYRIETFAMHFNFQPTIFRVKMQYNRPCKYSRPWPIYTKNIYFQLNPLSANPTKWPNTSWMLQQPQQPQISDLIKSPITECVTTHWKSRSDLFWTLSNI